MTTSKSGFNFGANFMNRLFRPVDNVVWDMMSGRVGVKTQDGISSIDLGEITDNVAAHAQVTVNPFDDFGMPVPAFAQSIPVESIALGDMIYSSASSRVLGWVVNKRERSLKLMKQDGTCSDWTPPKVQMLGFDSGVMVLRSLMNMLPGGSTQLNQMTSMMMPMMAMGLMGDGADSSGVDIQQMMPMILMSQMGAAGADPAASTNMMGNMMQMAMMAKMFGGGKIGGSGGPGKPGKGFFEG